MGRNSSSFSNKSGVIVKDLGYRRMIREINKAPSVEVVIGYHAGVKGDDGTPVAEYMAYNEFGGGDKNPPARPHMRPAFDNNVNVITDLMARASKRIMDGTSTVHRELMFIGSKHAEHIQDQIKRTVTPANSPSTIAAKGRNEPLRDTYTAFKSIHPIVRSKTTGNQ